MLPYVNSSFGDTIMLRCSLVFNVHINLMGNEQGEVGQGKRGDQPSHLHYNRGMRRESLKVWGAGSGK